MTPAERAFYRGQSVTSDPGEFAARFDTLSGDPRRIGAVVSGLVIHPGLLERWRIDHPHASARDAEVRPVSELLRRIVDRDGRPLDRPRPYDRRVIGTCRHYALVAVSILRHLGVPSRVRVGFATYFMRGFYEDHWLCEYWSGNAWRLLDAELGEDAVREEYPIDFEPWNVPRERFLTAGDAWLSLRQRAIDGDACGVSFIPTVRGAWFVGASVLRDLAALNLREMLPWDYWGMARAFGPDTAISPTAASRLDEIAAMTTGPAAAWDALRTVYQADADLRVPTTVLSFPDGRPIETPV